MFALLSNQKKILSVLNTNTKQAVLPVFNNTAANNMAKIVKSLSVGVDQLIANKQKFGLLIPQAALKNPSLTSDKLASLSIEELISNHEYLINTINTLCLTEAVIVRDNFSNCIELTNEYLNQDINERAYPEANNTSPSSPISALNKALTKPAQPAIKPTLFINTSKDKTSLIDKSNVSPIRLTQIKQRLAQAALSASEKQNAIKNRLNKLIDRAEVDKTEKNVKRA